MTATAGAGVHVEMDGVMKNLDEMQELIEGKRRDIMRYGRSIMKSETKRAFSSKVDPHTGRAWAARKESYPWPLLKHTGTIFAALDWSYGIKTKNRRLKFFGKIKDSYYLGGYNRGGGKKPTVVVAGSLHYGRTKARSTSGTRIRARGGGFASPLTGATPPRPFFGFGRSARKRIKRYAEKRIAKAFD